MDRWLYLDFNLHDPSITTAHGPFRPWAIRCHKLTLATVAGRIKVGSAGDRACEGRPGLWSIGPLVQDGRIPNLNQHGGVHGHGDPKNGWFIRENLIEMDNFGVPPF